jgi:hypothetical protein
MGSSVAESGSTLDNDDWGSAARREEMEERFSGVKDCQKGGGAGKAAARTFCCCCSSMVSAFSDASWRGRCESSDQDYRRASPHDGDEVVCCCAIWWKVEVREMGISWRLRGPNRT